VLVLPGFALEDISLSVKNGEFFSLIGPTGSGKTLILESIAGLVKLSGGSIRIEGRDATNLPPEKRGVGIVYQDQQSRGIFRCGCGCIQSSIPINPDHPQTARQEPRHWASGFLGGCAGEHPLHLITRRITPAIFCRVERRLIHRAASFCGSGRCGG
jgi:hypothetical protein